jgi:FAD/FMN-containing dehydrogenase
VADYPLADVFDGAARVLVPGRDDVVRFEEPTRGATGRASLVVQPSSVDEVREVVRRAYAADIRLLPQGANTGLVGASVPPAADPCVVLSLDLLKSSQPDVDVTNASVLVSAGTRLTVLNEAVARHGLQLPVDLAADPAIGGMIATNTGGNRMVRYGPMRRFVLGVEVVAADADATVYGRLGGVYKDSRGVDPVQLAVGSGGTLGVITRAVLSLVPRVKSLETWWLALDDPSTAVELYRRITQRRPELVSAFEFVSRAALERALAVPGARPNPFNRGVLPAASVLLEVSSDGYDPEDDVFEDDLEGALNEGLATEAMLTNHYWSWDLRHSISDALRTFGVVLGHDISAPLSALMPMRAAAIDAIAEVAPDTVVCDFGHAADGGLHLNVLVPKELGPPSPEAAASIRDAVDDVVARFGGSYSAEHGLGPVNAARWLADTPPIEQRMIAALKDVVDPKRLLGHPGHPYNLLPR